MKNKRHTHKKTWGGGVREEERGGGGRGIDQITNRNVSLLLLAHTSRFAERVFREKYDADCSKL